MLLLGLTLLSLLFFHAVVSVMKVEKAPVETYADIGGLEDQIQEINKNSILILKKTLIAKIKR